MIARILDHFSTRRRVLGTSLALGSGLVFGRADKAIAAAQACPDRVTDQEVELNTTPQRVYQTLLDSKRFAALTGVPAEIAREAGGAFKLFGDQVTGRNLELIPNRRIVQAWRVEAWPPGVYSIVRFELTAQGSGVRAVWNHTGFPVGDAQSLSGYWFNGIWEGFRLDLDL
jgi:activator of HSP90 ATPase